jgi:PAS domain S-box-containing protein
VPTPEAIVNDRDPDRADPRLIESEQRYEAVIENASDMIQSVLPDGTFEFVNRSWREVMGYTDEELAHLTVWELIAPESVEHCQVEFTKVMQGATLDGFASTFVAKDGRHVPIEGSVTSRMLGDEVVATHGFFRDISERLRTRELEERTAQLEREEQARYLEKMAALGKLSAGLAHELNNPAAAVQRANASLRETLARRDEALHALADAGLTAACWHGMEAVMDEVRRDRSSRDRVDPITVSETEAALETWLEDRAIPRAWTFAPSLAEGGVQVGQLERLVSHVPEAAAALAIAWVTETLLLEESMEIISQSSRRINELVQAIKGYSHMDRATEHDADIHDGLENTLIILAHRLRNVEIQREYDRTIPQIRLYGNTLNQVWTNIIDNAIDALDGSGRIVLRTGQEDGHVVVEIEDDGPGIPQDILPRIFEPFFTSKPQGQGTGLGLDLVWRIVSEEHNGTITARSEPGQTVFRVSVPAAGSGS